MSIILQSINPSIKARLFLWNNYKKISIKTTVIETEIQPDSNVTTSWQKVVDSLSYIHHYRRRRSV